MQAAANNILMSPQKTDVALQVFSCHCGELGPVPFFFISFMYLDIKYGSIVSILRLDSTLCLQHPCKFVLAFPPRSRYAAGGD